MKTGDDEMFDSENMAELDQLVAEEIMPEICCSQLRIMRKHMKTFLNS